MQSEVKELANLINHYPALHRISVANEKNIKIHWTTEDDVFHEKIFDNTIELLEWCDNNLLN